MSERLIRKGRVLLAIAACGLVFLEPAPGAADSSPARMASAAAEHPRPQPQHDAQRSASTSPRGPVLPPRVTVIATDPPGLNASHNDPVVRADGTLFVRTEHGGFIGHISRARPGGVLQIIPETRGCSRGPVIGSDWTIYAICAAGVVAFPLTGSPRLLLPTTTATDVGLRGDDTLIVLSRGGATSRGTIEMVAPSGALQWRYIHDDPNDRLNDWAIGPDGTVYVAAEPSALLAIDPDGVLEWRFSAGYPQGRPVVGGDGTIFFSGYGPGYSPRGGDVFAVNPDGSLKWVNRLAFATQLTLDGNRLYAGMTTALDTETGEVLWRSNLPAGRGIIGADGTRYVSAGLLYAMRPTGEVLWAIHRSGGPLAFGRFGELYYVGSDVFRLD